jgi:hypothetical protein
MTGDQLRLMIREVLAEEIARARSQGLMGGAGGTPRPQVREEYVAIRNDADLQAFVRRIAEVLKDGRSREEIERGRWVFRLGDRPPSGAVQQTASPARPQPVTSRIERGIVSERQIEALAPGTTRLLVGKQVRFTPLARDRLRMRGIEIERAS